MKPLFGLAAIVAIVVVRVGAAPAAAPRFVSVTTGADHVCALTEHGEVYCWGSNDFGQLGTGIGDARPALTPARVRTAVAFTKIAAGFNHTCGLERNGTGWCWGANDTAQLGDGTTKNAPTPTPAPTRVKTDVKFTMIAPGGGHTCAVSTAGVGYCWGGNWHGQLGVGDRDGDKAAPCCYRLPTPIRTDLRFRSVVAGGINSCAVAVDGRAYCWGSPQEGRLGTGEFDAANKAADKTLPTSVAGETHFVTVLPRAWHTCGLSTASAVFCWGGDMMQAGPSVPTRVAPDQKFTAITTGHFHDCAIDPDGQAYCWGTNTDGELGDGTSNNSVEPRRVATSSRFSAVAAGGNVFVDKPGDVSTWGFTCGVTRDGGVLCWGDNRHGALGNGSTSRSLTPTPIAQP